jgi:hypothetical protein
LGVGSIPYVRIRKRGKPRGIEPVGIIRRKHLGVSHNNLDWQNCCGRGGAVISGGGVAFMCSVDFCIRLEVRAKRYQRDANTWKQPHGAVYALPFGDRRPRGREMGTEVRIGRCGNPCGSATE